MDQFTAPDQPDRTPPVGDADPAGSRAKRSLIIGALGVVALLVLGLGLALGTRAKTSSTATVSLAGVTNGTTADGMKVDPTKPGLGGAIPNGTDAAGQPILLDGEATTTTTTSVVVPTTPKPTTPPTTAPKPPPTTAPHDPVTTPPTTPPTTKPTTTTTTDPTAMHIDWYKPTKNPTCGTDTEVQLTWSVPNATHVAIWIGAENSNDPPAGVYETYDGPNGTQTVPFACGGQTHSFHLYELVATDDHGHTVTQTIKISG